MSTSGKPPGRPADELAAGATLPAASGPGTPPTPAPTPAGWIEQHLPVLTEDQRYHLGDEIGRGGIGRVVRARDQRLERDVVIKELLRGGGAAHDRFLREARITAGLQHPSIVAVHDAGRWPTGTPFYAMKEVTGPTLEEVIARTPSLDERLALLPRLIAVAEAIAFAHSRGVIHRDLKPANVIVGAFGETVVIDWGLAKDLRRARADVGDDPAATTIPPVVFGESGRTLVGSVMGTPAYMPPEQARGEAVDEHADVYALGAMLYELLAGAPPYDGRTSAEVVAAVQAGPPPPVEARVAGVPQDLASLVARAMAREPAARYPSAAELAEDLKRFQRGQLVASHRYSLRELLWRGLQRWRAPIAVAAAALLLLAVLGVGAVRRLDRQRGEAEARKNALVLLQARGALDKDPTASVAWLKQYPAGGAQEREVLAIGVDAASRGVAGRVLVGHTGMVWKLAFAPDGRTLASAGADGTVRLWDLRDDTVRVLAGHESEVDCVRYAPDGRHLVTGSDDRTVRIWDVDAGTSRTLRGHGGSVTQAAFLRDGRIVTASYDRTIRVWDPASGASRTLAQLDAGDLNDLDVAPDGATLAAVGRDWAVHLLDLTSGATRALKGHEGIIRGIAYSPDGRTLATASYDRTVRLWTIATGASRVLAGHTGRVYNVAFSPDGRRLASASEDDTVRLWDLAGGESRVLRGHQGLVSTVAFSPDGALLATAGFDKRVRVWRVPPVASRALRVEGAAPPVSAALAADGRTAAFAAADGTLTVLDLPSGAHRVVGHVPSTWLILTADGRRLGLVGRDQVPRVLDLRSGASFSLDTKGRRPMDLTFSPDGERLMVNADGVALLVWTPATGAVRELGGYGDTIQSMRFAPDGRHVATTSGTEAWVWDVDRGTHVVLKGHQGWVAPGCRFSPDGAFLATASNDQTVRIWSLESGQARVLHGHQSGVRDVVFSPDGRRLASAGYDKTVRVWELATGRSRVLAGHRATVHLLAFSPDGRRLASAANAELTVRLWDLATGASRVLAGHTDAITTMVFSPDGRQLLTTSDRAAIVYTADLGAELPPGGHPDRQWLETLSRARLDEHDVPASPVRPATP